MDRRKEGSFGLGGRRRLRIGKTSQSVLSQSDALARKKRDTNNAHHKIPKGILVFEPHEAEQFPLVVAHSDHRGEIQERD